MIIKKTLFWLSQQKFINLLYQEEKGNFNEKAVGVSKVLGRAALRTTIKVLTAGALDDTFIEDIKKNVWRGSKGIIGLI